MDSKKIILNGSFIVFAIVFTAVMMWYLPDKALELLLIDILSLSGVLLLLRGAKVDQRKDERTIQLMTLSGRNAFFFLILAMPAIASFSIAGIITIDAYTALMILWFISLAITLISFFYYYSS